MSKAKTNAVIFGVGPRQGLGAELCHRAAARGLHVFVNGRTAEKIGAVAADIVKAGGSATPLLADVTDEAAVNQAVAEIEKDGRPLELAITMPVTTAPKPFSMSQLRCLRICGKSFVLVDFWCRRPLCRSC